jgi:uncharacterized protein YcfL
MVARMLVTLILLIAVTGCSKPQSKVQLNTGVANDNLVNNVITRPVAGIVSVIIGQGIEVNDIKTANVNGFMRVQVQGHNNSVFKKNFEYKVEWLDCDGMVIETLTSKWMLKSAMPSSDFSFTVVSPRREAADFRINTRM